MTNMKPMLLTETYDKSVFETHKDWIWQIKENGIRAIVHIKKGKIVGLRSRTGQPLLYCFPEFKNIELPIKVGLLDAEVCVIREGRSEYYGGIDQRRSAPCEKTMKDNPATLVFFDALHIDGKTIVNKPYKMRHKLLKEKIKDHQNKHIKLSINYGPEIWDKVLKDKLEGVVIKNPYTYYEIGTRSKEQLKFKNYIISEMLVEKVEPNDKGTKCFGEVFIDGKSYEVKCQLAGIFDVQPDSKHMIKYLDIVNGRLIHPTKVKREQAESYK